MDRGNARRARLRPTRMIQWDGMERIETRIFVVGTRRDHHAGFLIARRGNFMDIVERRWMRFLE